MTAYQIACAELTAEPRTWLVTGVAGFIGSHLLEVLLRLKQRVVGLDDFSTGAPKNLEDVRGAVGAQAWKRFDFREGSVADVGACREACNYADYVLHQAAFVSVPLSNQDPVGCHHANVNGTLNMLVAARDNRVKRFVHASSRVVYGNSAKVPTPETASGLPCSTYAASKQIAEKYVRLFFDLYGMETISLRYFNVFGPRQNPVGGYAAVVAQWIDKCLRGEECVIHGSEKINRDFSPVANAVQANILAATSRNRKVLGGAFNVGLGRAITLGELHKLISKEVARTSRSKVKAPQLGPPREGDLAKSVADIRRIKEALGFEPDEDVAGALGATVRWYASKTKKR
jgi:UDP-N-acetylglucosamine/UDP-N-acetyl-alpha-D-glucosaminouronate 4-epimerase